MLHGLTDVHFLFHFRLELPAYSHDLLGHVTAPSVLVAWRLGAFSRQLIGTALVLSVHVLSCEARVASTTFYSFIPFA